MMQAIRKEIEIQKNYLQGELLETIYFGGGTPSILSDTEISQLFEAIYKNFSISENPEITIEVNPEDINGEKLKFLKSIGVNRLSMGIQTFDDDMLKFLNRAHDSSTSLKSINLARDHDFNNISLDLIFSLPIFPKDVLENDLNILAGIKPEHISAYCLTIEENTALGRWEKTGKVKKIEEDVSADQFKRVSSRLEDLGYEHYEVSNYSIPGYHSLHNSNYWKQIPYLGVGPSSHSFDGTTRQFNISNNPAYIKSLERSIIPYEKETLSRETKINEFLMLGLRTKWGCDVNNLKIKFNYDLYGENKILIDQYKEKKLVTMEKGILKLTKEGFLFADEISGKLFIVE